ncbi:MAG: 1-acyl-sn-glycerol-3-phosphate acyltransferase [Candidatus Dormibacteria bacterium]
MRGSRKRRDPGTRELLALASSAAGRRRAKPRVPSSAEGALVATAREMVGSIDSTVQGFVEKGRQGGPEDRDPAFIRRHLRWLGPLSDLYFRGEVRGLERLPATGPVLCVGNHSGGLATPDSFVFMVNVLRHFGLSRKGYALTHNLVLGSPLGRLIRGLGAIPADPEQARRALGEGSVVLVYPGGDEDVFRSWRERNRIHLAGRTGFIRLALEEGVPIVPVVSVGGHETVLVLGEGKRIARLLGLSRFRIKSLPIVIGPPWGISPGDLALHLPLPAKITVECGEPIDFAKRFGKLDPGDPEVVWAAYRYVERRMQAMLDRLAAERRFPVLG